MEMLSAESNVSLKHQVGSHNSMDEQIVPFTGLTHDQLTELAAKLTHMRESRESHH